MLEISSRNVNTLDVQYNQLVVQKTMAIVYDFVFYRKFRLVVRWKDYNCKHEQLINRALIQAYIDDKEDM